MNCPLPVSSLGSSRLLILAPENRLLASATRPPCRVVGPGLG